MMVPEKYLDLFAMAEKEFPGKVDYVEDFDLEQLDVKRVIQVRDAKNRAPSKKAREYGEKAKRGTEFPPGVVTNGATPWVVDGNTRIKGYQFAGRPVAPMIVIKIDAQKASKEVQNRLIVLGSRYNQANGKSLESVDIDLQLPAFIELGMTTKQIAAELGISDGKVNSARNALYAKDRLVELGVVTTLQEFEEKVPASSVRDALGNSNARALHDAPFKALAALAIDKQANKGEVVATINQAVKTADDDAAVAVIMQAYADHPGKGSTTTATQPLPESVQLRKLVREMMALSNAIERNPDAQDDHLESLADGVKYLNLVRRNQNNYMEDGDA